MRVEKKIIGNKKVMPFTIPSGIITTEVSCLERLAREIPELGILTTKSIGPRSRLIPEGDEVKNPDSNKEYGNREPILAQYIPGGFINAVGLTNPGAEEFAKKLSTINFPDDKFLLASIFGKNSDEFVYVAKTLEYNVDGFELNLSCPHAQGYGMQLGQDSSLVHEIIKAIVSQTKKPVFAKLSPNVTNVGEIAKSAISAGAYGIVAMNTVGPGYYSVDGNPVLTNKVGGLSGKGIMPIGLKCVRDIIQAVGEDVPMIVMGGISTAKDIEAYHAIGKNPKIFGIGTAVAGMSDEHLKKYFPTLVEDLNKGTNNAEGLLKIVNMQYRKVRVKKKEDSACDFKIIQTNEFISAEPGQFVFAWIPGIGEKPFSVMDDNPLTLGILERGEFTRKLNSLQKGDYFYVRGPYGRAVDINFDSDITLVGGGCGIAGLNLIAKRASEKFYDKRLLILLSGKDKEHIPYLKNFQKYGEVWIATENRSLGIKGMVTDLFDNTILNRDSYFFNCGPKEMINAVLPLEYRLSNPERVYSSIDYMTRCGVGICGSCSDEKGRRTCVEGPFLNK